MPTRIAMAGYSGTPLPKKLGMKPGNRVLLWKAPENFTTLLGPATAELSFTRQLTGKEAFDIIMLFVTVQEDLAQFFLKLAARLSAAGGLWVAWPKKASGVATDLTEDVIREICLPTGLVDNKVCAIDEVWSGLRFVIRVQDRPKRKNR